VIREYFSKFNVLKVTLVNSGLSGFIDFYRNCHGMQTEFGIDDEFVLPLFEELYAVKETDFSIEINPLGSGKSKILMLCESKSSTYLDEADMNLLSGILEKGLRRAIDDIWLINIAHEKAGFDFLLDRLKPQFLISWGCDEYLIRQQIRLDVHEQASITGCNMLKAMPLSAYQHDQAAKGKLWIALKKMFFN